jgi:hypothetical protein
VRADVGVIGGLDRGGRLRAAADHRRDGRGASQEAPRLAEIPLHLERIPRRISWTLDSCGALAAMHAEAREFLCSIEVRGGRVRPRGSVRAERAAAMELEGPEAGALIPDDPWPSAVLRQGGR